MISLFNALFHCCTQDNFDEQPKDGERRPLLEDNNGVQIHVPRDSLVNNRQRIKDQLSNIVQDKQGKMINIADHPLSNLNQRDIPSTSTSRLRDTSPSPHPSIRTQETETTSSSSARASGDRLLLPKALALNVRLVRGRDHRGNTSRGRLGKFGEERGVEIQNGVGGLEPPGFSSPRNSAVLQARDIRPLNDKDRRAILHISNAVRQQLDECWKIEDSGPISRGWGD